MAINYLTEGKIVAVGVSKLTKAQCPFRKGCVDVNYQEANVTIFCSICANKFMIDMNTFLKENPADKEYMDAVNNININPPQPSKIDFKGDKK